MKTITDEQLLNTRAEFISSFGLEWFVVTHYGNYIWSDVDYGGDNSMIKTNETREQWLRRNKIPYGRSKGKHVIRKYCGEKIAIKHEV